MKNYKDKKVLEKLKILFLEYEIYPQNKIKYDKLKKEYNLKKDKYLNLNRILQRKLKKFQKNSEEINLLNNEISKVKVEIEGIENKIKELNLLDSNDYNNFNKILSNLTELNKNIIYAYVFNRKTITNISSIYTVSYRTIDKILSDFVYIVWKEISSIKIN